MVNNMQVFDTFAKMEQVLKENKRISVSVSGGSDSDILVHLFTKHPKITEEHEIKFIMFDTGLEFSYTKEHINFLEEKYNIEIDVLKAEQPIPVTIRKEGIPLIGKLPDYHLRRLQEAGFDFQIDGSAGYYECLKNRKFWNPVEKDGELTHYEFRINGSLKYFFGLYNTNLSKYIREYLIENGLDIKISEKCCNYAKKDVAKKYNKDNQGKIDCWVIGLRISEGGARKNLKNCYSMHWKDRVKHYYPLLHWTDDDKRQFNDHYKIKNSKCYTKMRMSRTGCAGCPYVSDFEGMVELIKKHDPKLHKAVTKTFGKSYELKKEMRKYKNGFSGQQKLF